jgi:hypothetical protein
MSINECPFEKHYNINETSQIQQKNVNLSNNATTDLSTDVQAAVPSVPMPSTLKPLSNTNEATHTLLNMLTRFVFIETFKWSTTDTVLPMFQTKENYLHNTHVYLKQYLLPQTLSNHLVYCDRNLITFFCLNPISK